MQGYASQRSNPVFQRPKHTLGSLRGETVNRSPAETARQAGRLLSGGGGGGTTTEREKKIPGISVRSWKDILIPATATNWTGSQMTSLPALPQPRS